MNSHPRKRVLRSLLARARLVLGGMFLLGLGACASVSPHQASLTSTSAAESSPSMAPPAEASGDIPFRLKLESHAVQGFPGVHSAAHALHQGKLIVLAGRRNGLHAFPPQRESRVISAFPPEQANDTIYVFDLLAEGTPVHQASVRSLPPSIVSQLTATNPQSITREGWLYVIGGYSYTPTRSMMTLDQVVAIKLDALVDAVMKQQPLDTAFAQRNIAVGNHPALKVTGGGVEQVGSRLLLIFGHQYDGLYTPGSGLVSQTYSESVRAFEVTLSDKVNRDGLKTLTVNFQGQKPPIDPLKPGQDPDGPYHRRDLTVLPVLSPDGSVRVAAYGGVFKGGRMEGYLHPVYITPASGAALGFEMAEDTTASQFLSQYEGAAIPLYSARGKTMYTTFLGGISQFSWDEASGRLKHDTLDLGQTPVVDGLPFINAVSTLRVGEAGSAHFLHLQEQFPPVGAEPFCGEVKAAYLGTSTLFVPAPDVPQQHEVILLDALTQPRLIGYLVGGIAAARPYPGASTCASSLLYRVTLEPGTATRTVKLAAP